MMNKQRLSEAMIQAMKEELVKADKKKRALIIKQINSLERRDENTS